MPNNSIVHQPESIGFLLGSTVAGTSFYYYILQEYKTSNEMLTEDIYVRTNCSIISSSHSPSILVVGHRAFESQYR
jgi:hypothetical protein